MVMMNLRADKIRNNESNLLNFMNRVNVKASIENYLEVEGVLDRSKEEINDKKKEIALIVFFCNFKIGSK